MDFDDLMEFAARTAERAGEITLRHFGAAAVEFKGDGSEVTAADRASEEFIRGTIAEAFPEDGLFGEEGTAVESRSGRAWIIDPIDGTRSFASGVPLYGILLALDDGGTPVVGCCHFPAFGQTFVAAREAGAWLGGRRIRVSDVSELPEARVSTSGLEYWRDWATNEGRAGFDRLVRGSRFTRTWSDCFGYCQVAAGRAEIMVDPTVGSYWDYAALVPILAEAGARFTTLGGSPVGRWTSALATNGLLHAPVMSLWEAESRGDLAVQPDFILARQDRA